MVRKVAQRIRKSPDVRRAEIVDYAIRIVGEFGYHGVTVQALADRCGMTNAGLLHHFGTKDGLLLAVLDEIERRGGEFMGSVLAGLAEQSGWAERDLQTVVAAVSNMARWASDNPEQTRFLATLQVEALQPSHPAHDWFAQRDIETLQFLVFLLGPVASGPPVRTCARYLMATLRGLILQWISLGRTTDLVRDCTNATRLLLEKRR